MIDMLVAMIIILTFPFIASNLLNDPDVRGPFSILGIVLEILAAKWAFSILHAWKLEAAWARILIHLYSFSAILSFSLCIIPFWIGMVIKVFYSNHSANTAYILSIATCALTASLVISIPTVEVFRVRRFRGAIESDSANTVEAGIE